MDMKKRRWVLALGAIGLTAYGVYRVLNSPSVLRKKERLSSFLGAFDSLVETVSDSAETVGILSKDLKEFLRSDSDQVPRSLKQVCKLTSSDEFQGSVTGITAAVTTGVYRGCRDELARSSSTAGVGFADRVIDRLFSEEGSGFASMIVGSFSRNIVMALYSEWRRHHASNGESLDVDAPPRWVQIVCEDKMISSPV